jgi:4-hydroxy-2-oxoheptanedioate aldolase
MFSMVAGSGTVPLARIPTNNPTHIKQVLDCGAYGVIVPMVNTADEARAVVAASRYAPAGARTIGGQLHAANFDTDSATYYERANDEILVAVMAEHVDAIENADEILRVPGIDVVFIGPNDLTKSMGLAPSFETDDRRFVDAVDHILKTARKYGVVPGIHVGDAAAALRRIEQGFQFIAVASDAGMLISKASEVARDLKLNAGRGPLAKY